MQHQNFMTSANDEMFATQPRERTVPIPKSITAVPGYPRKLVVYKIAANFGTFVVGLKVGHTAKALKLNR